MHKCHGVMACMPIWGAIVLSLLTGELSGIYLSSKIVKTKFGLLRGSVVTPNHRGLRDVEVFLGVPYAAPPVGPLRFMPPTTQKEWEGIRRADVMPPVCPQKLPDVTNRREALKKMPLGRYNYLQRLLPQLRHQNEDCLYLNIYAPIRERNEHQLMPVMVYIHGESYEWNSGNPYDGSVLASYGRVIVITVNFRLGVLGFLRHSLSERAVSNFGLLDQNAALHWIKENIKNFGGDHANVTIFGHGTGAALANLLLLSPITSKEGFIRRAILMSGSSLSRWAVTEDPNKYTIQVAKALKCPLMHQGDELVNCLRSKTVEELLAVPIQAPPFTTPLGPIVDGIVIKRNEYTQEGIDVITFGKYDIMYGVTSAESFNILTASEVRYGMSEERKNRLLRAYISNTFDHQTSVILTAVTNEYKSYSQSPNAYSPSRIKKEIRDQALDVLSDAHIVAPVVNMGDVHSGMNSKSYFYVFNHQSVYGDYPTGQGTVHGEELAYVFGAPLVGGFSHFSINYTIDEQFLSELVMTLWTNFAKTGNPNLPAPQGYLTEGPTFDWEENMKRMWPAYDSASQQYLHIDMQVLTKLHYRAKKLDVWNHFIPNLISSTRMPMQPVQPMSTVTSIYLVPTVPSQFPLPFTQPPYRPPPTYKPVPTGTYYPPTSPVQMEVDHSTPAPVAGTSLSAVIVIGLLILVFNCFAIAGFYYKRDKLRLGSRNGRRGSKNKEDDTKEEQPESEELLQKSPSEEDATDSGFTKSSSHIYHSNEVLLDTLYHSKSESTLNKKDSKKMPLSHTTLPRDISKAIKSHKPFNEHRRNKSENSIYSEVGIHTSREDIYKKNPSVKFEKSGTLPSKLITKSTSSIASIKSTSSKTSVKSSTSRTSAKSSGSSKPLKKNASVQSLPTSEYSWGITKEMTMSRHEPEGRDDKQTTPDSHQTVENFQKKNYPKVLPNVPVVISEAPTILRAPNRPHPPPRSTSLTLRDFDELEDMHVIYRKKKVPKRDASTDSCDLSNINPFYGMGSGEAPASPTAVYGTTPTATVRRSSGIYGQFPPVESPKVPLAPQAPKSPSIYFSRVKGKHFATFGKGEKDDKSPTEAHPSTPIILATSSAVVTSSPLAAYGINSSPVLVGSLSKVDSVDNETQPYSLEGGNENTYEMKKTSDKIFIKKKQSVNDTNREKLLDRPLKSALKQTSAYDKPAKQGNSPTSLSSSASINLSNVSISGCNSSNSSSASNSSIYASQYSCENAVPKKGAVVIAPTTRSKLK